MNALLKISRLLLSALTASLALYVLGPIAPAGAAEVDARYAVNVPSLSRVPVIDGKIDDGEWDGASGSPVALKDNAFHKSAGSFRVGRVGNTLYLQGHCDSLPRVGEGEKRKRDGEVWLDDSFEFDLYAGPSRLHLIVNAQGSYYDARDGNAGWNGPWQVAAGPIGMSSSIIGGDVPRGFVVEAALSLSDAEIQMPALGATWQAQILLNLRGANPHTSWAKYDGPNSPPHGILRWDDGGPNRIELVENSDAGRRLRVTGITGNPLALRLRSGTTETGATESLAAGRFDQRLAPDAGTAYVLQLRSRSLAYDLPGTARPLIPVVAVPNPSREGFFVSVTGTDDPKIREGLRLILGRVQTPLWSKDVNGLRSGQTFEEVVSWKSWDPGPVQLTVRSAAKDELLAKIPLNVPASPAWADYRLPEDAPKIPPPFTPVQATNTEVRVVGRRIALGKSPFMDGVTVDGRELLSGPVRLEGVVSNAPLKLDVRSWAHISSSPEAAVYECVASGNGLVVKVKTTIEYDGFVRYDWSLQSEGNDVRIDSLRFVVPVLPDRARWFSRSILEGYAFSKMETWNRAGEIPESGLAFRFAPSVWIGSDDGGISWTAEHRANWLLRDESKALEMRRSPEATEIVAHLASKAFTARQPLSYSFALHPTPLRPRPHASDWQGNRVVIGGDYNGELQPNEEDRFSSIWMPAGPAEFPETGCVELDFRVDWDPENGNEDMVSLFAARWNWGAGRLQLQWNRQQQSLVLLGGADVRPQLTVPVKLRKGERHRVALNWGQQTAIYLDGQKRGERPDGPGLSWSRDAQYRLGNSGRISLAGWRLSRVARTPQDLAKLDAFKPDALSFHVETLKHDPTRMAWTTPDQASLSNPAYLNGHWRYDVANRLLVPGPDMPAMSRLEHYRTAYGARTMVLFFWSKLINGHGGPEDPDRLSRLLQTAHAVGLRVIPYISDGMVDSDPAFTDYRFELSVDPAGSEPTPWWREQGQALYAAPSHGHLHTLNNFNLERALKLGFDGFYLDGYTYVAPGKNALNGTGAIDMHTGTRVASFPLFGRREQMKDMARLVWRYRPGGDGIIDAHASAGYPTATMSHVTDATNGESLGWFKEKWPEHITADIFAAEYSGRPYGFNSDALFYQSAPMPTEWAMALTGLHGTTPRAPQWGMLLPRAKAIWDLADQFDTKAANFVPFYRKPDDLFASIDARVRVSAFIHPAGRVLLLVANWSDDLGVDGRIRLDKARLGLAATAKATLLNRNEAVRIQNGVLELPALAPRMLNYIWIE